MADKIISDLEPIATLNGDELIPVENGVGTFSSTVNKIKDFILALVPFATTSNGGVSLLHKQVTISNGTDADHDLNFTAGNFDFDDGSGQAVIEALTKQFDSTFALGTSAGGMVSGETLANNIPVYLYQISNVDGSLVDIIGTRTKDGSTISGDSVVTANSLNYKKYLGAFFTDGSANIRAGTWTYGNDEYEFVYSSAMIQDLSTTTVASANRTATPSLSVPAYSDALLGFLVDDNDATFIAILITSYFQNDTVATNSNFTVSGTNDATVFPPTYFKTGSSREVYYRSNSDTDVAEFAIGVKGWKEYL